MITTHITTVTTTPTTNITTLTVCDDVGLFFPFFFFFVSHYQRTTAPKILSM